jgi:hypothetical protein
MFEGLKNFSKTAELTTGSQLDKGVEVEHEHKKTLEQLIKDVKEGNIKPMGDYYKMIAQDHIDEKKKYYDKLIAAGL